MIDYKERGILLYVLEHCNRIKLKVDSISKEQFDSNIDIKEIVCFNLFQIGELAKGLSIDFVSTHNDVPWKEIKGMRDRIGHGYGLINMDRVWETAKKDITPLMEYCIEILNNE